MLYNNFKVIKHRMWWLKHFHRGLSNLCARIFLPGPIIRKCVLRSNLFVLEVSSLAEFLSDNHRRKPRRYLKQVSEYLN